MIFESVLILLEVLRKSLDKKKVLFSVFSKTKLLLKILKSTLFCVKFFSKFGIIFLFISNTSILFPEFIKVSTGINPIPPPKMIVLFFCEICFSISFLSLYS